MFKISSSPLEQMNLRGNLESKQAGAFCCFEGLVRNHNDGKNVLALEYEACEPLCEKEAESIFSEAQNKFDILAAKCLHRVGKLNIGEMAVWVGVISAHRSTAFDACRYIIDETKTRLPIWKKEHYESGNSGWVNCEDCHQ